MSAASTSMLAALTLNIDANTVLMVETWLEVRFAVPYGPIKKTPKPR